MQPKDTLLHVLRRRLNPCAIHTACALECCVYVVRSCSQLIVTPTPA
jgi:hypothetical protein